MGIVKISDLPLVDSPVEGTDLFVVVQDNVTKKAYASDIQTYVGFEEIQYATAGQTVFNLTTMTYAAGANNLQVFVDGVNQYEGLSYTETDNNTVTFSQGLHVGAVVKFSTVQTQTSLVNSAGAVTFLQAGTGAVPRSVQSKERDIVSVKDFGAVGDGVTDDTLRFQACDNAGLSSECFVPAGTYAISQNLTLSRVWVFDSGAKLLLGAGVTVTFTSANLDYIGMEWFTGASNKFAFERAIASSIASSKPLKMGAQTIDLGGDSVTVGGKLWIVGNGESSVIQNGFRITVNGNIDLYGVKFLNFVNQSTNRGLMLIPNVSAVNITEIKIQGCTFKNNLGAIQSVAIFCDEDVPVTGAIENLVIKNNLFENVISAAQFRAVVRSGEIAFNRFINIDATNGGTISPALEAYAIRVGANFGETSWAYPETRGVEIHSNYIKTVKSTASTEVKGIIAYGAFHNVHHNYIEDIRGQVDAEGIYLRGSSMECNHNILVDAGGDYTGSGGDSDGAIVLKSVPLGKRSSICNNTIFFRTSRGKAGIMAWNHDAGLISDNVIYQSNVSGGMEFGIWCFGGWEISNNKITVLPAGSGIRFGYDYNNPSDTDFRVKSSVRDNYIYINTTGRGIVGVDSHHADIVDNYVEVNDTSATGIGIFLTSDGAISPTPASFSAYATLQGNRVFARGAACIFLDKPVDAVIKDNRLFNTDKEFLYVDKYASVVFDGNYMQPNPRDGSTQNTGNAIYFNNTGPKVIISNNILKGNYSCAALANSPLVLFGDKIHLIGNNFDPVFTGATATVAYFPNNETIDELVVKDNVFGAGCSGDCIDVQAGNTLAVYAEMGNLRLGTGALSDLNTTPGTTISNYNLP